jgi:hypothetical protein
MDAEWEDKVRARAYAVWEREGQAEGGAERHWAQAERRRPAPKRRGLPGGPSARPRPPRADVPTRVLWPFGEAWRRTLAGLRRGAWNDAPPQGEHG